MMPAWHPHTPSSGLSFNGWSFKKQPWLIPFISVLIQINTDRMTWVESYSTHYLILFLVGKILLYNTVMASTIYQHESAISSVQFSSVFQLCLTLCNSMDCSMPGFLVHHQLLKLAQTHVHWIGDAIQPSHPLSSPSPALNLSGSFPISQFISGGPSIRVSASASVLPMNIQKWFPLGLIGFISLQSKGLSRVFSRTAVQKHQFFSAQSSLGPTLTSVACKFGKLSSGHRTGKDQFSFQSQRKAMSKNAQTATQLHSSHTLVK